MTVPLVLILAVSFLVKAPFLAGALTGHFGSYQATLGMMAEMMRFDSWQTLLMPRSYLLIGDQPAIELLYYPFSSFAAFLLKATGAGMDVCGRLQAALFMLAATANLFFVARRHFGEKTAVFACFIFSFSPMVLVSGISFQNEAAALFFLLSAFNLFTSRSAGAQCAAGILLSVCLIARLHFIVTVPAFLCLWWLGEKKISQTLCFLAGLIIPFAAWLFFVYHFQKSLPNVATSLFGQMGEGRLMAQSLLLSGSFYRRIGLTLAGTWLTPWALPFLIAAIFSGWETRRLPFVLWLAGSLVTVFLLPQKVLDHPFYLIAGVPAAAVLCAIAAERFLDKRKRLAWLLALAFVITGLRFFLPPALSPRADGPRLRHIGKIIQEISEKDDKIIASYGTSCALLYYTKRPGWTFDLEMSEHPLEPQPRHAWMVRNGYGDPVAWLEYLKSLGARYFVVSEPEKLFRQDAFYGYLQKTYAAVPGRENFIIYDLKKAA